MTGHIPLSMSLAITWAAPLSFAAMAEAPQPLPTSRTVFPRHSSGLSKRYLQADVDRLKNRSYRSKCRTSPWQLKSAPWQRLSSRPVNGPVRVIKRPKFWSFSPKSAIWGQQSQFDLRRQAVLPPCLRVLRNKFSDRLTGLKGPLFKCFNTYFIAVTIFLRRKSSQHNFKIVEKSHLISVLRISWYKQFRNENSKHLQL